MMSYENQDMAGQASQPQPAIEKEEPVSVKKTATIRAPPPPPPAR